LRFGGDGVQPAQRKLRLQGDEAQPFAQAGQHGGDQVGRPRQVQADAITGDQPAPAQLHGDGGNPRL